MDKLKYIKLENEDGSYSSSIPLAVDSNYVDVNGHTLTEELNKKATKEEVASIASGSPAGVYSTEANLISADPNHTKIYVVTENGNWYYHNGTTWTVGGAYQAAEDSDTVNFLEEKVNNSIVPGRQLFDFSSAEQGYYYDYQNGGTKRSNSNWCNNIVNLKAGDVFSVNKYCYISYYTIDRTFISGVLHSTQSHGSYTVPNNVGIVIISCSIENGSKIMVELGSSTSPLYENFYYKFSKTNYIDNIIVEVDGDTKLLDVLNMYRGVKNVKVIVKKDINIITELGSTFIENYSSSDIEGYLIGSGIIIEFAPNTKVLCNYTGNNQTFITRFSPFAIDKGNAEDGFALINAHIIASRVRYCVHDELYNRNDKCVHKYINCIFELDNRNANKQDVYAIGCGSGLNASYLFKNCIFKSIADAQYADRQYGLLWHTSVSGDGFCYLNIIDNYFSDGIYLATGGSGTVTTKALISNNKFTKNIIKTYNSGYSNDTIEILDFNNSIIKDFNDIDVASLSFGSVGNQLYDYQKTDARGYYRTNGTFASNTNVTGMYIDLRKLNATDITTNIQTYSAFLDESKNVIEAYVPMSSGTYSIPSGAVYLYVAEDIANANRVMVNVGTTGLPYENYQRKLDAIIPAYNDKMIELDRGFSKEVITPSSLTFVHEGNNLINLNSKLKETDTYYSYSSGAKVSSESYDCITIPIKTNTSYVASNMVAHISQWDINDNFVTGNLASNVNTPVTFTTNENAKYLKISYSKGAVTNTIIPMLNEGANVLPFEPYNISIDGITSGSSRFKPYQSGFITFNVSVNQVIPEVNTIADTIADSQSFEDVGCMIKLPSTYSTSGKPTKLLMVCHGAGRPVVGTETCWINTSSYVNMIDNFVNNGYAVFDCNGASNTHYDFWGSPIGISAYRKAYEYVTQNYNVETNLNIYGFSMGGLTALNLVLNDFPNVKAVALGSPVINLEEAWSNNIASLYSTTTTTYSDELVAGYNPYLAIKQLNNTDIILKKLPPMKIWYGGNETHDVRPYVDKVVGQKLVNAIKNSNGVAQYREFTNCGHEICYGSNSNAYTEFTMWLNRF